MIDKKLFIRLVLPLSGLIILGLVLSRPLDIKGIMSNLVIEISGILITVSYVDWMIRVREKEKWKPSYSLIRTDYGSEALHFLAETTLFLQGTGWYPPSSVTATYYNDKPGVFMLEQISEEEIVDALMTADNDSLNLLSSIINARIRSLHNLLNRYSTQLAADDMNLILEFEGALKEAKYEVSLISYEPYSAELADEDDVKRDDLRNEHSRILGKHLKSVITLAARLFREFLA